MEELFLKAVNQGITASYLVLALVLLRPLLKKVPRWLMAALWTLVALRLVLPWSIESVLSLIPSTESFPETFAYAAVPQLQSGITGVDESVGQILSQSLEPAPGASANPTQIWSALLSGAWIIGVAVMLLYAFGSWVFLKLRMSDAVRLRENVFQSDRAVSPFVLGIFRPRIYLPYRISPEDLEQVVAHEKAHIRRRDHWWKPLGFVLLSVFWFHPLLWVAYILFCRDIEAACDEKVIAKLDHTQRQAYSTALLNCAVHHRIIAACPLAFGEVGVKERIKSVMHYKKPGFWIILVGLLIGIVVAVCFLTDPMGSRIENPWVQEYVPGAPGILGSVDREYYETRSEDFAIGADKYGRAVFKDPYKAFDTFTDLYADAISRIREAHDLSPISRRNYSPYKKYGWQLTTGTEEEQEAARFVTRFLDIYENSFLKDPPVISNEIPVTQEPRRLTLNDVIILSQRGYELTWEDFDPFDYEEGGHGFLIRIYDINSLYRLSIADAKTEGDPYYIYLTYTPTGDFIDIREGGVTDFISENRKYPEGPEYVSIVSRKSIVPVSAPGELEAFWSYLKALKPELKYVEKLPQLETIILDHWNNIDLIIGYVDREERLSVSGDGKYIWTEREGQYAIYSVPDPEELIAFLERWTADMQGGEVTGQPFATAEEPWKWTAGITLEAVEEAEAFVKQALWTSDSTYSQVTTRGYFTRERFIELVEILNAIPESAFSKGKIQERESFSGLCRDVGTEGMSVAVIDGVNALAVTIRCRRGELEMALCSDMEKVRSGYLMDTQIWKIQDDKLIAFLEELFECPPVTTHFVGSGYEWTDEIRCSFEGAELSLRIIQGWKYEIIEQTEHYGIRCRPGTEDRGWIYFSFWPEGYYPEETDDRFYVEGVDHGYPSVRSYPGSVSPDGISYDTSNAIWSYCCIHMDGMDLAIINDGADSWFSRYVREIEATRSMLAFSLEGQ